MDRYAERMNLYGTNQRERDLNRLKQSLIKDSPQSLSCKDVTINGLNKKLVIDSSLNPNIKEIKTLPNENIVVGDYVFWADKNWLVTEADSDDEIYIDGKMQLCNWTLLFQSPTGTILSYPCIDEAFNRLGENETDTLTEGNAQHTIKLPFDENTVLIREDMRFFLDKHPTAPTPYKVTQANTTTYNYGDKGLIVLSLKQDKLILTGENPDRVDLGVCNYKEVVSEPTPVEGYSYSTIVCSNSLNQLTIGGTIRTLTPQFYNADGTISSENIIAVWTWNFPNGYDSLFKVTYVENIAKISVAENYDLLGMTVTGNVMSSNGGYGGSITLEITI